MKKFSKEFNGYNKAEVKPTEAYYHQTLREFILPYSVVQKSKNSEGILLEFLNSTYEVGARLAKWDRVTLDS